MLLGIWSYHPSLSGGFVFDDDKNLADIRINTDAPAHASLYQITFGNQSGPLGRPVTMFTFAIQMVGTGMDPFPMKVGNLVLHALTGGVLFLLAWLIGTALGSSSKRAAWIGAAAASLWLVHPLNLTAVAYIVQRMTSLSALFTALAILAYVSERFAQRSRPGRWLRTIVLVAGFGLLAAFSKETGLLTPVYLIVIELVVFRFRAADTRDTRTAKTLVAIVLSSLALVMVLYPILHSNPLNGYAARPFDLEQRLLTEARVVSWYLAMLLVPDVQQMTLYHDGLRVSAGLLAPPTTLFALAALVTLLLGAIALRHRAPWFSFGMLFFFAGHLLESTVFPLELVFEHRNYLPSFGVLFAIVTGAALGLKRLEVPPRFQALAPVPFIVILSVATHIRAHQWSGDPAAPLIDALNHPESPRANIIAGNTFSLLAKGAE